MNAFQYALEASAPQITAAGGNAREAAKSTFPVLDGIAIFSHTPSAIPVPANCTSW
jgi:hypothetical protein